jgi:Domain of unknown function (DUF4832)/Domain of unknown function (DUF4874)
MKLSHSVLLVGLFLSLVACQGTPDELLEPQMIKTYQVSTTNFSNPERGFYVQKIGWDKVLNPTWESLTLGEMQQTRRDGYTLMRVYYMIPEFKGKSLSQEFLDTFRQDFKDARTAGIKLIPLFSYSWPSDDYGNHPERPENQDAPVADVVRHIGQLKTVLDANADVLAFWDAGFIGPWGEWHTSTNGLLGTANRYDEANSKTRQILTKLLEVVPTNRMITLRYVRHKTDVYGPTPLTTTQAFNGSAKARVGAKNDCFLASNDDWGTYYPDDPGSVQTQKDFLHQDNLFLPQGGETCNAEQDAQPYIDCPNALSELAYMRYSTLNVGYHPDVLQGWKDGGCYNEVSRRFGYRFELVSSSIPAQITQTQNLRMSFVVKNVGFASPYNPRGLAVVLRNKATSQTYRMTLANGTSIPSNRTHDPRFWQPGTSTTVGINRSLPSGLPKGEYDVLLHLFDPALQSRPAYAVRLANVGTWESATGYNTLQQKLSVR